MFRRRQAASVRSYQGDAAAIARSLHAKGASSRGSTAEETDGEAGAYRARCMLGSERHGALLQHDRPLRSRASLLLAAQGRLRGAQLERYVRDELYRVLHAPRQTGKTTFLMTWMRELNADGEAIACYVSVERCQGIPEVERAMAAVCSAIRNYAKDFGVPIPDVPEPSADVASVLTETIRQWSELCAPRPLVVLFDEVDTLEGPALVSFLRQLRGGFASRGVGRFPVSVALVGMRDLRDYLAETKGSIPVNAGSPFNMKKDSATLSNFTRDDVVELLGQHTDGTGQVFEPAAAEARNGHHHRECAGRTSGTGAAGVEKWAIESASCSNRERAPGANPPTIGV